MTDFDWGATYQRAQASSFEPAPAGNYLVRIHSTEAKSSKEGKPQIEVHLKIAEGPYEGKKIRDWWTLTLDKEDALAMFFAKCAAFGIGADFITSLPRGTMAPLAQALVGRMARADLIIDTYNDRKNNKIKSATPVDGQPPVVPLAGAAPGYAPGPAPASAPPMGPPPGGPSPVASAPPAAYQPQPAPMAPPAPVGVPAGAVAPPGPAQAPPPIQPGQATQSAAAYVASTPSGQQEPPTDPTNLQPQLPF